MPATSLNPLTATSVASSQSTKNSRAADPRDASAKSSVPARIRATARRRSNWRPGHIGICWPLSPASKTDRSVHLSRRRRPPDPTAPCARSSSPAHTDLRPFDVQLQSPRKRVKNLSGRILVAALLQPQVIVGADTRQHRQLLAPQAPNTSPRTRNQPDIFGTDLFPPRTKVSPEGVAFRRHKMSLRLSRQYQGYCGFLLSDAVHTRWLLSAHGGTVMVQRQDVEFPVEGDAILRGWLFVPDGPRPHPGITMAHGFAGVRNAAGAVCPPVRRSGVRCWCMTIAASEPVTARPALTSTRRVQIADWRRAISFLENHPAVDPERIGLWGTSYAGGHAIVSALPTAGCVRSSPRCPRSAGMSRVCVALEPSKCPRWRRVSSTTSDASPRRATNHPSGRQLRSGNARRLPLRRRHCFYNQPVSEGVWQNFMTVRSSRAARMYEPGTWISRVSPTPLLMIVSLHDTITVADLALAAYERRCNPRNSSRFPVGTSTLYLDRFAEAGGAARDWFTEQPT